MNVFFRHALKTILEKKLISGKVIKNYYIAKLPWYFIQRLSNSIAFYKVHSNFDIVSPLYFYMGFLALSTSDCPLPLDSLLIMHIYTKCTRNRENSYKVHAFSLYDLDS